MTTQLAYSVLNNILGIWNSLNEYYFHFIMKIIRDMYHENIKDGTSIITHSQKMIKKYKLKGE